MKNAFKITLCAICAALSASVIMLGYFPYLTYSAPALAGLILIVPTVEIGQSYAFATYLTSSALVAIFAEPETKVLYIVLFGFYPILKSLIERLRSRVAEWAIKLSVFTASFALTYYILRFLTDIDFSDLGDIGKYGVPVFVILCYIAFVLYDIAVSRIAALYFARIRPKLRLPKK